MRKAFPGHGPENDALYQRAGHFLLASIFGKTEARTWCDKKGVPVVKAASEGIGSAGGFLVPEELENAILDLRDSFGAFRRRACVWPMSSDSSSFPRRVSGTTAFFFGEDTAATAATILMDQVKLTAKKLGALVLISSELEDDSIHSLVDYVANELAWAFANKEDDCAFNGDGTSTFGGMKGITQLALDGSHGVAKVTAASGHNTFATLTAADMAAVSGAVRGSAIPRAAWFVSNVGFAEALQNEATGGYLETETVDGVLTRYFNGYPVVITQKLPNVTTTLTGKAMLAFGDMYAGAVLGQRRGLTIARSDHRYLDTDQIAILGTERFDAVVHDLGDNLLAGSLAVLVAP
jgi:HK97 family phage major capsid protein